MFCKQQYLQFILLAVSMLITACGGQVVVKDEQDRAPKKNVDISRVPDPVPRAEPKSKYGNPKSYEVFGIRYYVMDSSLGYKERGIASWYGEKFHGRRTSSGETYDMYAMTAAHKSLPLPTYVSVRNLENGRKIIVRVNDRGPFHQGRIIDLSYTAAQKLDIVRAGTARVEVEALNPGGGNPVASEKSGNSDLIKTNSGQGFYIQAGSFAIAGNAKKLQQKLAETSAHMVSVNQVVSNNNTLYRVLIGPVSNIDVADRIILRLEELGIYDSKFVSN